MCDELYSFAPCTAIPLAISTVSGVAVAQDRDRIVLSLQAEAYAAQSGEIHVVAAGSHEKVVRFVMSS